MTKSTVGTTITIIDPAASQNNNKYVPDLDGDNKLDFSELHRALSADRGEGRSGIGTSLLYRAAAMARKETGEFPTADNLAEYLEKALKQVAGDTIKSPLTDVARTFVNGVDVESKPEGINMMEANHVLSYLTPDPVPFTDGNKTVMEKG
ncbi:MAG: hypothetical protein MRY32_03105 [Rickettsiales bacterium]|nr:hypothetical protein [Rickettsiales bacterium]